MKLKNVNKEDLENMSYDDIAYLLLENRKRKIKIIDLFNEVGKLVHLDEAEIEDKIGDFFEMLTLDKRFIMLDDGAWDLRSRHAGDNLIIDDDEDMPLDDEIEDDEELDEEEEDEDLFYDDNDDDTEDDLKDLVVIDEDEEDSL